MKKSIALIIIVLFISTTTYSQKKKPIAKTQKSALTIVTIPKAILRNAPTQKGKDIAIIKQGEKITIINEVKKPFIKAKYKGKIGFIKIASIKQNSEIIFFLGTNKTNPNNKPQHKTNQEKNKIIGTYNGKKVFVGPKGGKYYINKSKNKTYLNKEQMKKIIRKN